ncbi:hypothetical protein SDC9_197678 [bioreactor metagenome]|uniref:Uncharacterized protein n=1 Tax=bioreactor metagenome TaxID=1076179 RepID=A0A645IGT3_9ZZZZ
MLLPDAVRNRKLAEPFLDGHLSFHIADVVHLESGPFVRRMLRKISGALTVCCCWCAGLAKVPDELFALRQLLLLQLQHGTYSLQ